MQDIGEGYGHTEQSSEALGTLLKRVQEHTFPTRERDASWLERAEKARQKLKIF